VIALIDLLVALIGLSLLGVGLWWKDPALSLAVVGGALFLVSIAARITKPRTPAE